jgi:hypothetical protein
MPLCVTAHAYPWPPVQAEFDLPLADCPQPCSELSVVKDPEPAPGVVRRVPRHMRERGQCQRRDAVSCCLVCGVVQQGPAQLAAGVVWMDRYLLHVQAAVDHIGHQVRDRLIGASGAAVAAAGPVAREERKVVTVLFADLVGFTSRAELMDPEDVRAGCREPASRAQHRITVIEVTGRLYRRDVQELLVIPDRTG